MKKCGQHEIYLTKLLTEILLNVTENTQSICSLCEHECISTGDNRENSWRQQSMHYRNTKKLIRF